MGFGGEEIWYCPFCQKQTIRVFHNPRHKEIKVARGNGRTGNQTVHKNRKLIMLSEKCSACGRDKKEIEPLL